MDFTEMHYVCVVDSVYHEYSKWDKNVALQTYELAATRYPT